MSKLVRLVAFILALGLTALPLVPRQAEASIFSCTEEGATEYRVAGCCTLGFYQFTLYRLFRCQGGVWKYTTTTQCGSPLCEL